MPPYFECDTAKDVPVEIRKAFGGKRAWRKCARQLGSSGGAIIVEENKDPRVEVGDISNNIIVEAKQGFITLYAIPQRCVETGTKRSYHESRKLKISKESRHRGKHRSNTRGAGMNAFQRGGKTSRR